MKKFVNDISSKTRPRNLDHSQVQFEDQILNGFSLFVEYLKIIRKMTIISTTKSLCKDSIIVG